MAIAHSHLKAAGLILSGYDGSLPFPEHARGYFRAHKQHGGRDRKQILAMCYAFFRMGASLDGVDTDTKVMLGSFLTLGAPDRSLQELDATLNALLPMTLEEKLQVVKERYPAFRPEYIFPWTDSLGGGIDPIAFSLSHLIQPDLFVRVRPGKEDVVSRMLGNESVAHEWVGKTAIRFSQGVDLTSIFTPDHEVVVQDLSSQRVQELMKGWAGKVSTAWDCCAGSGGKSILVHDTFPQARISASDVRPSILHNLRTRLRSAGISPAATFNSDLEHAPLEGHGPFDLVVADVPCSGSGTWGRNPEWLRYFDPAKITVHSARQKAIAMHAIRSLKPGGCFLYVTCSVFRAENEEVVGHLQEHAGLRLEEMRYLTGYAEKADTMFAARLTSPA